MALKNQPYLPLYIQDWLTNNKLKQSSLGAHGLLINTMCLMHKEDTYGKILLKQKFKQTGKQEKNFALMLAKLLPFDLLEIEQFLPELIFEKILIIEGDFLVCSRMVKDAELSTIRALSGKKGGNKTKGKSIKTDKNFAQAKIQANTENENEIIIENEIEFNTMPLPENFNGLPEIKISAAIQLLKFTKQTDLSSDQVIGMWDVFKIQNLTGKKWYANKGDVYTHFLNWIKKQDFINGNSFTTASKSVGREVKFDKP